MSLFRKKYRTPAGTVFTLYEDMLEEEHLLIGGAPGSGKSVMVNNLITTLLTTKGPGQAKLILIDPKKVELAEYRNLPHTISYGNDRNSIISALEHAVKIIDNRLIDMQHRGLRKWDGGRVYIIIDELLDIMSNPAMKKACYPMLQKIAALGRAPGCTLIACTQSPVSTVIPTPFKACFPNRVALRTATAQDCRNIIQQPGAEDFPNPRLAGKALCLYRHGADLDLYNVPTYGQERHDYLVRYWLSKECRVA